MTQINCRAACFPQHGPGGRCPAWRLFLALFSGIFAAGTPAPIVDRLNAEPVKALHLPEIQKPFADVGMAAVGSSPAELDRVIRANLSTNRELVKALGLKLD